MNPATIMLILELVDMAAAGIAWLAEDRERYDRLRGEVETMIREGRQPSPDEFLALVAESREVTARIRAAAGEPE